MKPAPFKYAAPDAVGETVDLLAEYGHEGKLLAGGQSLVPLLNMRLARPGVLIDLNRVGGLDYIREDDGVIAIGAMTRQRAVERSPLVREQLPLLWEAIRCVGHPQIRNRGTVGGSLAHADPSAELPAVAVAGNATFVTHSPRGRRTLAAPEFFVSYLSTALEPDELLTEIRFPVHGHKGTAFLEVARRHGDFALAGVAVIIGMSEGRCTDVQLTFMGVGPTPTRVPDAEAALVGRAPDGGTLSEISRIVSDRLDPDSDIHASAGYRRRVSGALVGRAVVAAVSRA